MDSIVKLLKQILWLSLKVRQGTRLVSYLWGGYCWVPRVHAIAELKNVNWGKKRINFNMKYNGVTLLNPNKCVKMEKLRVKL